MNDKKLEQVSKMKYLGVWLDQQSTNVGCSQETRNSTVNLNLIYRSTLIVNDSSKKYSFTAFFEGF